MIKPGDIVFLKRTNGILKNQSLVTKSIGLVIKEYQEKGAVTQYMVKWQGDTKGKWYYQHNLHRLQLKGGKNNEL
jgi:hypothetical protein